ncbi:MAG: NAD(P)H-dependent oxidoreductase [Candidatus Hadarchaeum sp.]|uniref:NAD(P)H-dependent oxidoreductase n=1 Tax=Candidatus Hadarchaeum sp. TaxID=2883567 RepID=UPI00316FC26E
MPKVLIVYDSASGNTEKMAHAVAEGAKKVAGVAVVLRKVDQAKVDELLEADGVIIGSPCHFGQMSAKMKTFVDESVKYYGKLDGKVGAAFTSFGGSGGSETTLLSIIHAMLIHGMVVVGRSNLMHYGSVAVGSPSQESIENCRDLGYRVANIVAKLAK